VAAENLAGREDPGERAGGEHHVGHRYVRRTRSTPHHLQSGVEVNGVDQQWPLEILEGALADQTGDELVERLPAVDRRAEHAAERHVGVRHAKHVMPLYFQRAGGHLVGGHPAGPRGSDERTDAGADHQVRHQPPFVQGAEHTDMGETLEASSTEDQGELGGLLHRPAPTVFHRSTPAIRVPCLSPRRL
jgi:hypothetical protein